ncbi:MAG: DoxX family protein [Burkholderiales bacterium]
MNSTLQNPLSLIGRLLIAYVFLPAGIGKIAGFAGTAGYIASKGLPMPEAGAALAIAVEVIGGLALVLGFRARWAAIALAIFTLAAGIIFHNYWAMPADAQMLQKIIFDEHMGLIGGLLLLAAFGPGGWSLDARRGAAAR